MTFDAYIGMQYVGEGDEVAANGTIRAVSRSARVGRRSSVVRTEVRGNNNRLPAEVTTTCVPT